MLDSSFQQARHIMPGMMLDWTCKEAVLDWHLGGLLPGRSGVFVGSCPEPLFKN